MDQAQQIAQQRFRTQSFFILTGLPPSSEFGLDGKIWTVDRFSGVKLLPAGLHMFVFSAAPTSSRTETPESLSSGVGVRHGLLHFFGAEQETVIEEWDNKREQLVGGSSHARKRRRTVPDEPAPASVVSLEYLKTLDGELAPYSDDIERHWRPLVDFVTPRTLARVVGVDERGYGVVDAVMGSVADEHELKAAGGKQTWGKSRAKVVEIGSDEEDDVAEEEEDDELLRFVHAESKRSWPEGAVGEELTRWSKDKSWRLSDTVNTALDGDVKELLAELQLAFLLFTLLHNFSSLATYKAIFSLICRSSTLARPVSSRPSPTSPASEGLLTDAALPMFASFLSIFTRQIAFLDDSFFSEQMPGLDNFLLTELDALHASLSDAAPHWAKREGSADAEVWLTVVRRWDTLTAAVVEKYGWELPMIKGSRKHGYTGEQMRRAEAAEDEVDIEDLEEGEDAPVIVEMD